MRKYYLTFLLLTLVVLLAVVGAFLVSGNPFAQKALKYDSQRLSRMSSIKYSVDSYYRQSGSLPKTIDELPSSTSYYDPETQKPFEYKLVNQNTYSLCTTFSTDTKNPSSQYRQYSYTNVGGKSVYHSKGYDCIELQPPVSYARTQPTPTPTKQIPVNTYTFYGTVDTIAKSDTTPRMIIKDNYQAIRIFYLGDAEVINKSGEKIDYTSIQPGDRVIVDAPQQVSTYSSYQARRVQNLSR